MSLTILGNNSALPAHGRNPTSQVLQIENAAYLIDCGEGTQWQMRKYRIKPGKINHVFISHLHGDHYFGLPGLLNSMCLSGRTQDLHLYAPPLMEEILKLQFAASGGQLTYKIYFHHITKEGNIANDEFFDISCFRVTHRIECWGFLFSEKKKPRSLLPERTEAYEIPVSFYNNLQRGEDYKTEKGTIIPNEEVTTEAPPARQYAYCGDTLFDESIADKVKGVDLLYHETTFLQDMEDKATARFHSTTKQAGQIAKLAGAKKLIIGHFSSRYESLEPFLTETRAVFENTDLALEGTCFKI